METDACALQQIPLSSLQYYELVLHAPDVNLACCSSYLRGSKQGTPWKLLPRVLKAWMLSKIYALDDQADPIVPLNPRPPQKNKSQNPKVWPFSYTPNLVCVSLHPGMIEESGETWDDSVILGLPLKRHTGPIVVGHPLTGSLP